MTRKKSNVKALALAVTCAILAGGGIGLEPVYAANVQLNVNNGAITAGSVSGTINGTVGSTAITGGTITGGNLSGGTFTGTVTLTGDNIKTAIEGVDISLAKVGSDTDSLTIGNLATNTQKIIYAAETGTTVDGVVLKDKGITAADGNFTVNGTNAETVVSSDNGKTTIYGGGINVEGANGNGHVAISSGSVTADVSVTSKIITDLGGARMEGGKVVAKNGLYIGATDIVNPTKDNSKFSVDGTTGNTDLKGNLNVGGETTLGSTLDVTSDTTVGGDLTVNGAANFSKETTFTGGIKTDTISEKSEGKGVTVDGVVLKDGGITAAGDAFKVDGTTGNVTTTGDIQGKDINATGALKGQTLGIGTNGSEFTVDANGNAAVGGTLDVTGKTTLKNELQVNEKATFGIAIGGSQTVINGGDITATGKLTSKSASIGTVGITDTGVVTGITKLTAKELDVTDSLNIAGDIAGSTLKGNSLKITGDATISGGLAVTGNITGATLNLWKDNDNSTYMTAGGVTFTGDAGEKGGKVTTINGGTISTDTLNVERINLGEDILDSNGNPHGSNLSMDKQGNFSAAGGNFKVTGGSGADKGAFTNTVGNTTLQTDNAGASMKFNNTAVAGGVTSEVAVGANTATVAAGDKASFVATTDNGGTATITGGTQTVTTTDKGTVFENSAHKTPFVENGATTTIINGNEITTGKITTDQLVITGQGDAAGDGSGSLAFGGNGTIKSDVKEAGSAKNTQFTTDIDGVTTKVTDGTNTTENNVSAAGNSNTVTNKDATQKSEFNQGLTSIGGVVTNGTVKIAQTLDGENGNITNEVTDKDGKSSKLVQNGTGLEYTDSAKPDNATRIDSSDVSIGSATDDSKRINLSDLGQIDELDKELTDRDEYKNNPTAVGGINAEAAIRREEVARLDGRINDVNDRVNKVGAMAAAIASLKSIGYDPQAPSEFSIGLGQYKGETGVAMGFFHYPNKNFMINVSLSTAGGETMGGIGATWRFGHKSPQKLLEEQREAQAKKELAAAEKYQAAAKLAKEAQERAEYAAKLARQAQVSADNARAAADATQAKHFG